MKGSTRPYMAMWWNWKNISATAGECPGELSGSRRKASSTHSYSCHWRRPLAALKTHCLTCHFCFFTKSPRRLLQGLFLSRQTFKSLLKWDVGELANRLCLERLSLNSTYKLKVISYCLVILQSQQLSHSSLKGVWHCLESCSISLPEVQRPLKNKHGA